MPARVRTGIVALCDAVYRDEASNKIVIAGLYSGHIVTDGKLADLQLALYIELHVPDAETHKFAVEMWAGGKRFATTTGEVMAAIVDAPVAVIVPKFRITGPLPTVFQLKISMDGGRATKVLEKKISQREPESPDVATT